MVIVQIVKVMIPSTDPDLTLDFAIQDWVRDFDEGVKLEIYW